VIVNLRQLRGLGTTVQLLDPFGQPAVYANCGSGEAGECDQYGYLPGGRPGDWGGETYLPDDPTKIPGIKKPATGITGTEGLMLGLAIVGGIALVKTL
jgi:hypothetical protein